MPIKKVDSSMVWAVDYDARTQILEIAYKRGGVFRYSGVPVAEYRRLMKSDSIGSLRSVLHYWCLPRAAARLRACRRLNARKFDLSEPFGPISTFSGRKSSAGAFRTERKQVFYLKPLQQHTVSSL